MIIDYAATTLTEILCPKLNNLCNLGRFGFGRVRLGR